MSALSQQMNMNNFLSLLLGASLVAANSSPTNDAVSHTASADFPSGVTTFTLPNEHIPPDTTTLASFNYSYENGLGGEVASFVKEKAKYGEGKILNVTGLLVHITSAINGNDHTGCEKFWNGTNGGALPTYDVPWIALIKRGRCNFEDKVKHAYWYRAIGVIIYNDKDAQTLDKMKILDKERNITAVFTFKYKGEELAKLVEEGHNVVLSIIEGNTHTRTITNINRTSVLFVSISFIVLMIISLVWLVFYYVQRFRYLQTKDKQSRRLCNVAKRIIAKIPTKSIKSDDKEIDNDCCAICIEPYKVTDVIRVLPCRHEFHKACIDPWLLEHRTCPMCKMDILKHYGFVFTGSQESILQLDLDMEEGDMIDDHSSIDGHQRRNSVSPLPQIRTSSDHRMSRRSSTDSDSEPDVSSPNENTPSLDKQKQHNHPDNQRPTNGDNEICVGCLAAALKNKQMNLNTDESENDALERHGSTSLPTSLKKYKGTHSTISCRGINPPDHYHHLQPQSKLPFKFYKTDRLTSKKARSSIKNLMTQSVSAPCDNTLNSNSNVGQDCPSTSTVANFLEVINSPPPLATTVKSQSNCDRINMDEYHQDDYPASDDTETNSDNDLIRKSRFK